MRYEDRSQLERSRDYTSRPRATQRRWVEEKSARALEVFTPRGLEQLRGFEALNVSSSARGVFTSRPRASQKLQERGPCISSARGEFTPRPRDARNQVSDSKPNFFLFKTLKSPLLLLLHLFKTSIATKAPKTPSYKDHSKHP